MSLRKSKECFSHTRNAKDADRPRPAEDGQRVIARLEDDKQLLRAPGWHEKDIAREWGEVQHAPDMLL